METPIIKCNDVLQKVNLYVKREDLLPFSFGGNKVRIANEFYADMENKGFDCIVGYGNSRSNLSRAIASLSASKGIPCHIISPADDNGVRVRTNNSVMVNACGAVFHECLKTNVQDMVESVIDECVKSGLKPYYIYGNSLGKGNEVVPVRAYDKAYQEILLQEKELGIEFDYIFLPTGTGMTQAGLLAGQALAHRKNQRIIGISVARTKSYESAVLDKYVRLYIDDIGYKIELYPEIIVEDRYLAGGYGHYNQKIIDIIRKMFINYSLPLDVTYTGKGFWGMMDYLNMQSIEDVNVLFIHTGGIPLFFDKIEILSLI